jgi:hypothetical protein
LSSITVSAAAPEGAPGRGAELGLAHDLAERHAAVQLVHRLDGAVVEGEETGVPQEDVEERLPDLDGQDLADDVAGHEVGHDQHPAQPDLGLLLHLEPLGELLLGEVPVVDEELAEELAGIVGGGRHRHAALQAHRLAHGPALAGQGPGLLEPGEQLDEDAEREDGEAAH